MAIVMCLNEKDTVHAFKRTYILQALIKVLLYWLMAWSASVSDVYPMKAKFLNTPSFVYFSEQSVKVPTDPNIDRSLSSFIWK